MTAEEKLLFDGRAERLNSYRVRIAELEAEVAALREDEVRLDWLQASDFACLTLRMTMTFNEDIPEIDIYDYNDRRLASGNDIRKTIDDARREK